MALNGWIRIAADGAVQLAMPRSEMGQGVHTALAMLVAEELELALAAVQLDRRPAHDAIYGNVAMFVGGLPFHPREAEPGHDDARPCAPASGWWPRSRASSASTPPAARATIADAWEPLRLAAATARARLLGAASLAWRLPVAELDCARRRRQRTHRAPQRIFGELADARRASRRSAT